MWATAPNLPDSKNALEPETSVKWIALGLLSVVLNFALLFGAAQLGLHLAGRAATARQQVAASEPEYYHAADQPDYDFLESAVEYVPALLVAAQVTASLIQLAILLSIRGMTRTGRAWLLCVAPPLAWLLALVAGFAAR